MKYLQIEYKISMCGQCPHCVCVNEVYQEYMCEDLDRYLDDVLSIDENCKLGDLNED